MKPNPNMNKNKINYRIHPHITVQREMKSVQK